MDNKNKSMDLSNEFDKNLECLITAFKKLDRENQLILLGLTNGCLLSQDLQNVSETMKLINKKG